ncbi:MAG: hypothetical protein JW715_10045 [Sedimentisphaerales bacterium]|nr:hypothetical protein [Sedimentisphaerales bacterium]
MIVSKTHFIIYALCFLLLTQQTQSAEITVGDQTISIPSPSGFTEISSISPETVQLFENMCPPTNRLLAIFVTEDDAGLLILDKAGQFNSYMLVQSSKEMEAISFTKYQFKEIREMLRSQFDSMFEERRDLIDKLTDQTSHALSNRFNEEIDFDVGDIVPLGIDSETASSITASLLGKYKITVAGDVIEQTMAATMCFLLVNEKVVYLYVYRTYDDKSDLDWTRKTNQHWMNEILKANSVSLPLSLGRIVPEGTIIDPLAKELIKGEWEKYSTKSHPKSEGLDISLEYPQSWRMEEGERPHIVQKFIGSSSGDLVPSCLILIRDQPLFLKLFPSKGLSDVMFTQENLKEMIPESGIFIESEQTEYDGQRGAWMTYIIRNERAGMSVETYMLQHMFLYSGKLVLLQCSVSGITEDKELLEDAFNSYLPVFQMMANSIVIQDKWSGTGTTSSTVDSIMEDVWGEYWLLSLIISVILTWVIGLTPPLIIRFVIARRPLSKSFSITLVVLFCFFNIVLFTILGSQSKTHAALFLVAFVSYAILRKGWRKGSIKPKAKGQEIIPNLPSVLPKTLTDKKKEQQNNRTSSHSKESEIKRTEEYIELEEYIEIKETEQVDVLDEKIDDDSTKEISFEESSEATNVSDINEETLASSQEVSSLNQITQPTVLGKIEKCANCERIIGKLEHSYKYKGNIVCIKCYQILSSENN